MRRITLQLLVEVARVGKGRNLEALLRQIAGQQVAQTHVVVDDQDFRRCGASGHGELDDCVRRLVNATCNEL